MCIYFSSLHSPISLTTQVELKIPYGLRARNFDLPNALTCYRDGAVCLFNDALICKDFVASLVD